MRLSVIVPAHNEATTLGRVIGRVRELPGGAEIIVVDDASTDGTEGLLNLLAGPDLTVVRLSRNMGKGTAVREGLGRATGDLVAIQDADLELDPAVLTDLCEPIRRGDADAVFGARFVRRNGAGAVCRNANRAITLMANLLFGGHLSDIACGHKVVRRVLLEALDLKSRGFDIEAEVAARLLRAGARIVERPVPYAPRTRAEGKKPRYFRDGLRAAWMLLRVRFAGRGPTPAEADAP